MEESCAGARCLQVQVREARARGSLGGCEVLCQEHGWSCPGSFHFFDEQFFFPFFCPPALCWHGRRPLPPMRAFPQQVLQTPVISQTFLLETLGHIPL